MAEVINIATRREHKGGAQASPVQPDHVAGLERTPELALVMALIKAMPLQTRQQVLASIETMRRSDPDSPELLGAQFVAAKLARGA